MNRQKLFRQYFTPPAIARAMVELVKPHLPPNPLVADLACGEGILLSTVLEQRVTTPDRVWGGDIDPQMKAVWDELSALQGCHLFIQDGLSFDPKAMGLENCGVDLAIGNPPFNRAQDLITDPEILKHFDLGRRPLTPAEESLLEVRQLGFDFEGHGSPILVRVFNRVETVVSQPIEAIFLEKFVQVTRLGGYIIIILPEGLLSNEGSQDVRDFMVEQTDVLAIIGLPRRVFDNDAKTNILLLRKKQEPGQPQQESVFLATVSKVIRQGDTAELEEVVRCFRVGPGGRAKTSRQNDVRAALAEAQRVFYVTHSADAWQTHLPERWLAEGYLRWVGSEVEPQRGDLLLIYKFPARTEGAGFCAIHRVAACEHHDCDKKGYYVASEPWLTIKSSITYHELAGSGVIEQWNAYRVRFRGWAKSGRVPDRVWSALWPQLANRGHKSFEENLSSSALREAHETAQ